MIKYTFKLFSKCHKFIKVHTKSQISQHHHIPVDHIFAWIDFQLTLVLVLINAVERKYISSKPILEMRA